MTFLIDGKMSGDFLGLERSAVCFCHHRHFIRSSVFPLRVIVGLELESDGHR